MKEFKPLPDKPAPADVVGVIPWLKDNLFPTPLNSLVTLALLAFFVTVIPPLFDWLLFSANWSGTTQDACTNKDGACWVFVIAWSKQFFYGSYPIEEVWRIHTCLIALVAIIVASFKLHKDLRNKVAINCDIRWLSNRLSVCFNRLLGRLYA